MKQPSNYPLIDNKNATQLYVLKCIIIILKAITINQYP